MRKNELVTAALLVGAGFLAIAVAIPRHVAGTAVRGGLSPAFMPYVAAVLLTLAAVAMLVGALRHGHAGANHAGLTGADLRFLGLAALVLGGSYALMSLVGYVAGGIALVAGLLKLAGARPLTIVAAAVAAPAMLWLVFAVLFATPLP